MRRSKKKVRKSIKSDTIAEKAERMLGELFSLFEFTPSDMRTHKSIFNLVDIFTTERQG